MLRPQGYATLTEPDGRLRERDTFTCGHCQRIVHVPPAADPASLGGFCCACGQLICPRCYHQRTVGGAACVTWERRMEQAEARDRALRSYGL